MERRISHPSSSLCRLCVCTTDVKSAAPFTGSGEMHEEYSMKRRMVFSVYEIQLKAQTHIRKQAKAE